MNDKQKYAANLRNEYGLPPRAFRSLECDNEMTVKEVAWIALEGSSAAYEKWYADFGKKLAEERQQSGL